VKVIVTAKFRGEMPYEMWGLDTEFNDADLIELGTTLPERIDKAVALGTKKGIAFGLAHQALTMEQAKNKAAMVTQIFVNKGSLYQKEHKGQIEGANHGK